VHPGCVAMMLIVDQSLTNMQITTTARTDQSQHNSFNGRFFATSRIGENRPVRDIRKRSGTETDRVTNVVRNKGKQQCCGLNVMLANHSFRDGVRD
jgi:hypothetical protein